MGVRDHPISDLGATGGGIFGLCYFSVHGIGDVLDYRDKFFSSLLIIFETAGAAKLKIKEMGSCYLFILLDKDLSRNDYRKC